MAAVDFNMDNMMKCICTTCPVQAQSACAMDKGAKVMGAMESGMEGLPAQGDVPGLYCSTGTASCDDLDFSGNCICAGCAVYAENGLTQYKYCERGSAATIG
jgi:hypothetical protein